MARKPRVDLPAALYHVIAGGNRRAVIMHDEADATAYLERLECYRVCDVGMPLMRPNLPAVRSCRSADGWHLESCEFHTHLHA